MDSILLDSLYPQDATMISNVFIDEYMPEAHGDYVKVYLYLLRHLYAPVPDLSVTSMAEHFDNTEKDILKAIQYWERQGLLKTERTKKGMVEKISLIKPQRNKNRQNNPGRRRKPQRQKKRRQQTRF